MLGDLGLRVTPGTGLWWALRPVWLGIYLLALLPFALGFGRFERSRASDIFEQVFRLHYKAGRTRSRTYPVMESLGGFAIAAPLLIRVSQSHCAGGKSIRSVGYAPGRSPETAAPVNCHLVTPNAGQHTLASVKGR